jgi:hypothetical protein
MVRSGVAVSGRRRSVVRLFGHPGHRTVGADVTGRLAGLFDGRRPPGVYRWRSRSHPSALRRELARVGWSGYPLPGHEVTDGGRFLDACAAALAFPTWFAHSWSALGACLVDLTWLPGEGHVVLWERYGALAGADGVAWRRAYETLVRATGERVRYGAPPLYVLLRGPGPDRSPVDEQPIPVLPTGTALARS